MRNALVYELESRRPGCHLPSRMILPRWRAAGELISIRAHRPATLNEMSRRGHGLACFPAVAAITTMPRPPLDVYTPS